LEGLKHYGFIFLVTQKSFSRLLIKARRANFALKTRKNMFSLKMITFGKSAVCPASEKLLTFQNGEATEKEAQSVRRHLAVCEFCAAEVEFYAHYPQSEEKIERTEIPLPLYELAHALLSNQHKDFASLNKLLSEPEVLKI
jgi:hypothetical protein